jgi:plastocyanin
MAEGTTERRRIRGSLIVALIAVGTASIVFSGVGVAAAATIEGTNSSAAWSPNTANITTAETVTFKNSSMSLAHGLHWNAPPAMPSCPNVPVDSSGTNWAGDCSFSQAGSYPFVCTVHPSMTGTVTVTSSGPGAPIVSTSAATSVSDTTATLKGSVDPNGLATEYFFKYGTTAGYGSETGKTSVPAGTPVTASTGVTGLSAATTYHFRLFAENTSGTTEGGDLTFTTTGPPLATTTAATPVSNTGATLRGTVNPRGHATTYFFKYGETTSYGQETSVASAGSGTSSTPVSAPLTGLSPETTYHFLLVANNSSGTDEGDDQMLTTTPTPADSVVLAVTPPAVSLAKVDPPPTVAPNTTITLKPKAKTMDRTPTFKFKSSIAGAVYECKLDGKGLKPCRSPLITKPLSYARHTLKVAAIVGGLKDPSPATYRFKVIRSTGP